MEEKKQKKMYREIAAVMVGVIVDEAAIVVNMAAVVVANVQTSRAVDRSEVFILSCKVGLNLNLSGPNSSLCSLHLLRGFKIFRCCYFASPKLISQKKLWKTPEIRQHEIDLSG